MCFVQGKREHGPVLGQGQNQRRAVCIQGSAVCQLALPVAELAQGRSLLRIQRNRHLCTRNTFAKLCTQRHCARSAAGHRRLLRQPLYTHIRPGRRVAGAALIFRRGRKACAGRTAGGAFPLRLPFGLAAGRSACGRACHRAAKRAAGGTAGRAFRRTAGRAAGRLAFLCKGKCLRRQHGQADSRSQHSAEQAVFPSDVLIHDGGSPFPLVY